MGNITDMYEFDCKVVHYENSKPITIIKNMYRSNYIEFYKGTKTVKSEFTILPHGKNKFMAYIYSIDNDKKKGIKTEFRGNLLWGYGKALELKELKKMISLYTNLEQVKKDYNA